MPITFTCSCGKILRVADEHAGRRVKCPACNTVGSVPAPEVEPVLEVVENAPFTQSAPQPAPPAAKPRTHEYEEYDGTVYGLAKSGGGGSGGSSSSSDDDDDEPRDKPLPDFRLGSGQRGKKRKKK